MTTAVSQREPTLAEVLAAVAAKASYLRAATEIDAGWHRCDELIANPSQLAALVRRTAAGRGAPDDAIAASLFVQAYAFRVGGIPVAAQVLDLPAPATHPDGTAISIARDRPNAVAFSDHAVARRDDAELMQQLNEQHFSPLVEAVRTHFRVGERLLWGNIASSCATAMRAVDDGSDPGLRRRGEALIQAASPWWKDLGQFTTVRGEVRTGWYWDRTNCCLWYRTAPGRWCDDCSLLDRGELLERRLSELAEPAS